MPYRLTAAATAHGHGTTIDGVDDGADLQKTREAMAAIDGEVTVVMKTGWMKKDSGTGVLDKLCCWLKMIPTCFYWPAPL